MNIPNKITLSRILLIPIFILLLSYPFEWGIWEVAEQSIPISHLAAVIIFAIASATDWLDGYYARKYQLVTNLGKFLDPMADKLLVSAAFILLVELGIAPAWIVIIIISREFAVTGLRLVAAGEGVVLAAGQLGKLKTVFQILAIIVLLLHNVPFSAVDVPVDIILLYVALIFTIVSGLEYFIKNWHVMGDSK
ncbi:CDP-diacylglycerol--glycerol-3-phosphate 3-phosphatidyltransferase [Gracilibacillus caseinilyticus]|uniref:CDP-diacylglycerol--glycerol-3-phosphate 3-phosphatidyltransferase n=1 Tax=Gracilibacillus caseinilyticus TaxID=2932256 RepID=A0ABY4EV06_9BACI|nr:CDP-diacylglycerol--glycerol-3-phosphate 3-phosphatidyltransferase [Gracilibacillus caseinilyticus]UOQ47810.1 CDP-diacylglycerol--glycerol-3-phosphate 3-phosphatidyltransferase [Gracilibacillus caseinilyticus]